MATVPLRPGATEAAAGRAAPLTADAIDAAIDALATELDPMGDLTNSAETKRHLACVARAACC